MLDLDAIFKAYDVRGTVPDQFDEDVARNVGAAFARFTGADRVVVARDMRPSGVALSRAFIEGVVGQGADVVDIGLASTDLLYYAAGVLEAPGAMFTASHNPAQYNGIKLCLAGARPVGQDTGLADIKALAAAGVAPGPDRGTVTERSLVADFADHVRSFAPGELRPLKVVADTANGMGGLVVPEVFAALPFELEVLFGELDGTFPNHPADPIQPENQRWLRERVLATGADVGLAFDGDADRVFLVDDQGIGVSGSTTTAMVAADLLDRTGPSKVIHNLICSKAVPEVIREHGGEPVRTRVGHSFIKTTMAETGAVFGGEHSGHYYFRDNFRADSGLIAAMVVLRLMSASGEALSTLRKPFERYADSGEINTRVDDPRRVIAEVESVLGPKAVSVDHLDGVTFEFGDWWCNLRPSNTEPLLRLNLEAADEASCRERTAEVVAVIEAA